MGRRKIEIKAIKDDRNRSVTFLKRKGGLFKKAHELSVLCSVDVAVFIFGSNKKLYEYSSSDMSDMIARYQYHQGPNEHKGPSDFNGGGDDEEDEEGDGTPPHTHEGSAEPQMMSHFHGQPQFGHLRGHTPSASPPIANMPFAPRGHTPQPGMMSSRPSSRNDFRRPSGHMPPSSAPQGPQQPVPNGYAYMPQPPIYSQPGISHGLPAQQHGMPVQQPGPYGYQQHQPHQQVPHYVEDQRQSSLPPNYPPQVQVRPPSQPQRPHASPQPPQQPLPQQPHVSPPLAQHQTLEPPQHHHIPHHPQPAEHQPPPPQSHGMEPPRQHEQPLPVKPSQPLLDTSAAIKRGNRPGAGGGSIFTPVDEGRSILGQHLASFGPMKEEPSSRSHSVDIASVARSNSGSSPPQPPQRASTSNMSKARNSVPSIPETTFTPPSRSDSLKTVGGSRPRLKVQIPDEQSDGGSNAGNTAEENTTTTTPSQSNRETAQPTWRNGSETQAPGMVLPPPSPSASALLSAGATGPPNPFAKPPPQTSQSNAMKIDTPASALPSRMMGDQLLPSPSSFFNPGGWSFNGNDSNTLASPLNFATPVTTAGPSFLREDAFGIGKRKSPDITANGTDGPEHAEAKRIKVDG